MPFQMVSNFLLSVTSKSNVSAALSFFCIGYKRLNFISLASLKILGIKMQGMRQTRFRDISSSHPKGSLGRKLFWGWGDERPWERGWAEEGLFSNHSAVKQEHDISNLSIITRIQLKQE